MTVATNMATVARLGNPSRLSSFGDQVLLSSKCAERENEHKDYDRCREDYNEQSWISNELVNEPHTASEEDAP